MSRRRSIPPGIRLARPRLGQSDHRYFFLAYGSAHGVHRGTDQFDFGDQLFRLTRFATLFDHQAKLTDPVAFLATLQYRALKKGRFPAKRTLNRLAEAVTEALESDVGPWTAPGSDLDRWWSELPVWKQRVLIPAIDAVRHAVDASPFQSEPLDIACPILMDRPDSLLGPEGFPAWVLLIERLLPHAQLVVTLGDEARNGFPRELLARSFPVPAWDGARPRARRAKVSPGAIALIDVDGTLPNLALMKLAQHLKRQGRQVVLARAERRIAGVEAAFASSIFTGETSVARIQKLRRWYGDGLSVGGSGVDLARRLPPEVEALPPDYSLYPELGDRAIGFLTRGCPFTCPFCVVPAKEGQVRQVTDLGALLAGRRKLILLDDNILAHPKSCELLEEMVRREIEVNFTQTLDLRLVTRENAALLRQVRSANTRFTRRAYYFSLNNAEGLERVKWAYDRFEFTSRDNVEFVCMYAYNTTLEEDVARFRFLRSLPGAYVFVQEYRPVPGGADPIRHDFFGPRPDHLIRELVSICFPQNMKSTENYYRWLGRQYALAYGKVNTDLVETIFRYNKRWQKGLYVATLAGTRAVDETPGRRP